jgi:hypothetical protein
MHYAATHSPGPWTVFRLARPMTITGNVHQVVSEDRYPTAFVPAWDSPVGAEIDGTEEAKANARLIAAAPDLLAMLKVAQLWLDVDGRYDMQGINAAIAKALQP